MEKSINNKILNDDEYAIKWLMEKIKDEKHLVFAKKTKVLLGYARKTLEDLKVKDFSNEVISNSIIENVKKRLENESFASKCLNNKIEQEYSLNALSEKEIEEIKNLTNDQIEIILKSPTEEDRKLAEKIIQVNRFYNMQLKYAHTARTVYVAEQMLKKMEIKNDTIEDIILVSAVMHDVGRFYQALEYNNFADTEIEGDDIFENTDIEYNNFEQDHASAGYYFALSSNIFNMNDMTDMTDKEILINIISAFVIRFHQKSNSKMLSFDMPTNNFFNEMTLNVENLQEGIVEAFYEESPLLKIEENHKKYIREALEEVFHQKMPDEQDKVQKLIEKIMEEIDNPDERKKDFLKELSEFFEKNKEKEQIEIKIPLLIGKLWNLVEKKIKEEKLEKEIRIDEDEKNRFSKILKIKFKEMIDYDVAYGVYKIFGNISEISNSPEYNSELNEDSIFEEIGGESLVNLQSIINMCLQTYNRYIEDRREYNKKLEPYKVVFSFPLNFITDADKMDIWNQRALGTYPTNYVLEKLPVMISEDIEFEQFFNELAIIDKEQKEKIISDYREKNKKNNEIEEGIFKKSLPIFVPKEYAYAYEFSNKKESDKKFEIIINKEDQEKFYKYDGMKRENHGPIRALLWTINQFIFTNTRTKAALEIIKENKFLERTYSNYSEEIREYIKPYMQYTLYYIDEMIKSDFEIFNAKIMKEQNEKIYVKYKKLSDKEKSYYAYRLDEDRLNEGFNY